MAISIRPLTREWIQFLKNNKIVSLKSDPKTGRLNYQRPVTTRDVIQFLVSKTDYNEKDIKSIIRDIKTVPGKSGSLTHPGQPGSNSRDISDWFYYGIKPGEQSDSDNIEQGQITQDLSKFDEPAKSKKFNADSDSISDVDYRELSPDSTEPEKLSGPELKKKPRFRNLKPKIKEDIRDNIDDELSEDEIEEIFHRLVQGAHDSENKAKQAEIDAEKAKKNSQQPTPAELQVKKEEDLRKLKRIIRDVMTDSQRKSLWRMLNEV